MKKTDRIFSTAMVLFILFVLVPLQVHAGKDGPAEDEQTCLNCHKSKGLQLTFENKESLPLQVDVKELRASVHAGLACANCHTDFSIDTHLKRKFPGKREYTIKASRGCRLCHSDRQIKTKKIHLSMLTDDKTKVPVCVDCHGFHSIKRISGGKVFEDETQYCLNCHKHKLGLHFKSGDNLFFQVDPSHIQQSVHSKLGCSDCHLGFSIDQHPQRNFKSRRDYSIAASDTCRRCHFDKYTKTLESVHYTLLSQGDLRAPVCTDCHGSHFISSGKSEKIMSARRCQKCHEDIFAVYSSSVHGKALLDERNQDVPICVDCHNVHSIEDPRTFDYREKVPGVCGNCHANKAIMAKYGLSTEVVNTYLQDFHGITLKFYKKQKEVSDKSSTRPIAVCTDCHGIHDIAKARGQSAAAVKANLMKRCRKCHANATRNFPESWISHYEPSLERAPLVYIINLIYKIFIPFMIIGLILQILLHIWRYAVNR